MAFVSTEGENMQPRTVLTSLTILLAALLLAACAGQAAPPTAEAGPIPVALYLAFQPDVQFAPFYVGLERGIFADHGLDVSITHQSETDALRLVGTDTDDPGIKAAVVSGEQVLLARAQDLPVVYVFEWYEQFPVAIASKADRGIETPADLAGHSVGTPMLEGASYIGLEALLASAGLSDEDIDLQVTGFTQVETLLADRVDAVVVYTANEPIQLDAAGVEVNLIAVSDHADLVSNGLVVNEQVAAAQPDVVRALVAALAEAVQYAIDHPDEAYQLSQVYVEGLDDPDNEATQREVLARSIELWRADRLGQSDLSSWVAMQDVLLSSGLLDAPLEVEGAFNNGFLP
jgi:NitT/TauT family transport system substrate-binding protein